MRRRSARVQEHIRVGDCYQVNLTQRFEAEAEGDAWHAYVRLREINPAPFAAYLDLPDGKIVSSSPERFLRVRDGHVETKPIKGTRPRSKDPARDRALAEELRTSAKDRAENVMIVDLLRNDLGQVLRAGLGAREQAVRYRVVRERASAREHRRRAAGAGQACARSRRGVFSRRLDHGRAESRGDEDHRGARAAAAQRLLRLDRLHRLRRQHGHEHRDPHARAARRPRLHWAGGGVVADSNVEAEYQESLDKAAAMLAVMAAEAAPARRTIPPRQIDSM